MIIKILIGLVAVIAIFAIVVAMQPSHFVVARSISIVAPPAIPFSYVNDLHKWQEFSPWAKMDPAAKTTFEGPVAGTGAKFSWDGNSKVGAGGMTLLESRPSELVKFQIDFKKPFEGTNIAEFTFKPEGAQTIVTWKMSGESNFIMKAVGLFMNCDKMVGVEFEKGLADLKSLSEGEAKKVAQ